MNNNQEIKQFSFIEMVLYHLLPGLPILFFTLLFANPTWGMGLSIYLSLMLAILCGLLPVQLGILFFHAKKENKSLKELILFHRDTTLKNTLAWALPCIVISFVLFGVMSQIEPKLWGDVFSWVPDWFRINLFSLASLSQGEVVLTFGLGVILNGVLGPLVEEIYFRGFLLPRMEKAGKFAPLLNTVLFSLYHLFTPWENITRILAMYPFVYAVWRNKNIKISIIVHLTLNTLSMVGMIVLLFS